MESEAERPTDTLMGLGVSPISVLLSHYQVHGDTVHVSELTMAKGSLTRTFQRGLFSFINSLFIISKTMVIRFLKNII